MFKKEYLIFIFLIVFQNNIFSQDKFDLEKLDNTIDLQNIDYKLINLAVLFYTNNHRKKYKKSVLKYNNTLEKSALLHSLEMNKYNFFDHINRKNKKFKNLEDRAKYVGYSNYILLAENLYYGFVDLRKLPTYRELSIEITQAFITSRSHNFNLLDNKIKELGCYLVFKENQKNGFLNYYFTQSFGTK